MLAHQAHAQWTFQRLSSPSAAYAEGKAVRSGRQGGNSNYSTGGWKYYASSWRGAPGTETWLTSGNNPAAVDALDGNDAVGMEWVDLDQPQAALWRGTSRVNLNPAGFTRSEALAAESGTQAGWAYSGNNSGTHAGIWKGSASSWKDLNPAGFQGSAAYGVFGSTQVGSGFNDSSNEKALMWTGTAASAKELPLGAAAQGRATGVWGNQISGYRYGSSDEAGYWRTDTLAWTSLSSNGHALATWNGRQVGVTYGAGKNVASLWTGTSGSFVDLSTFTPANTDSIANAVWDDGANVYVVGTCVDNSGSQYAAMWTGVVPEPNQWLSSLSAFVFFGFRRAKRRIDSSSRI